jgi:hypothetical protein
MLIVLEPVHESQGHFFLSPEDFRDLIDLGVFLPAGVFGQGGRIYTRDAFGFDPVEGRDTVSAGAAKAMHLCVLTLENAFVDAALSNADWLKRYQHLAKTLGNLRNFLFRCEGFKVTKQRFGGT